MCDDYRTVLSFLALQEWGVPLANGHASLYSCDLGADSHKRERYRYIGGIHYIQVSGLCIVFVYFFLAERFLEHGIAQRGKYGIVSFQGCQTVRSVSDLMFKGGIHNSFAYICSCPTLR